MSSQRRPSKSRAEEGAAGNVPDMQQAETGPLRLVNLLNDIDLLAELLPGQIQLGAWLDAFLLTAGVVQMLEDALHPDPLALNRIASRFRARPGGIRHLAAAAGGAGTVIWAVHGRRSSGSALAGCRDRASALAVDLARLLVGGRDAHAGDLHARALDL